MRKLALLLALLLPVGILGFADFGGQPVVARMAAVAVLMAVLWITEAVPLAATALLPLALFPLLGISSTKSVASQYMNSVVFLLIGGFMIALAMERWGLHRRIALNVLAVFGNQPTRLMAGFIVATSGLSMWISNTATTLMMLPIALASIERFDSGLTPEQKKRFSVGLLLAIAYAASIGGMMTPIGTAPNMVFLQLFEATSETGTSIGFAQWMMMTVPIGVSMLVLMGLYLGWKFFHGLSVPDSVQQLIIEERNRLGAMSFEEKVVATVFAITATLWVTRKGLNFGPVLIPGWQQMLENGPMLDDAAVVILMSFLLFLIPARSGNGNKTGILDSGVFLRLPWPVVILFGGGFALASGFVESGLSAHIASQLASLEKGDITSTIGLVCTVMTFLTELTSNTATTQLVLPILDATADAMQVPAIWLMLPATLSASCAFMLPVATPPNAIIFGSGKLRVVDMVKCGFILNLIGIVVIVVVSRSLIPHLIVGG